MLTEKLKNKLSSEPIYYGVGSFVSKIITFIAQLILITLATKEDVGIFKVAYSYVEVIYVLCGFGFALTIIKTAYNKKIDKSNNFIGLSILTLLISSVVVPVFLVLSSLYVQRDVYNLLKIFIPLSFFYVVQSLVISQSLVNGLYKKISNAQVLSRIFALALLVLFSLSGEPIYGIASYYYLTYTLIILALLDFRILDEIKSFDYIGFKKVIELNINLAWYSLLSNFLNILNKYYGYLVVGFYDVDKDNLGTLSKVVIVIAGLENINAIFQQYCVPKLSSRSENKGSWKGYLVKVENNLKLLSFLIFLFIITGLILLKALNYEGENFFIYTFLLSASWFISSFYSMKGASLITIFKHKDNLYINAFIAIVLIILSPFLIGEFDVFGIVLISVFYNAIMALIFYLYFRFKIIDG